MKIGHARISEHGTANGSAGDQTGGEVAITNWYPDKWIAVYRAKNEKHREIIAKKCEEACNNNYVGYSQYEDGGRLSLFKAVCNNAYDIEGLTKKVNCDCSALVMTCCRAAGITVSKNMITATEDADLMNTGAFIKYTTPLMLTKGNGLQRGDILLKVGHTAIVVEGFNEPVKPKKVLKIARFFDRGRAGSYKTTCTCNLRYGASLTDPIRKVLPADTTVYNYGYYNTDARGVEWLLVIAGADVGYVSRKVLTR